MEFIGLFQFYVRLKNMVGFWISGDYFGINFKVIFVEFEIGSCYIMDDSQVVGFILK